MSEQEKINEKAVDPQSEAENQKIKALWEKYEKARQEFEKDYDIFSNQVLSFQEQLKKIINSEAVIEKFNKKMTYELLAEKIDISPRTLARYTGGSMAPSMNTVMMICVALQLDIKQSTALLESLGYSFLGTRREHYAYMYLLDEHRGASIEECNEILTGLGIEKKYQLHPRKKKAD